MKSNVIAVVLISLGGTWGCRQALSAVLDIPQPPPKEPAVTPTPVQDTQEVVDEREPPPFEATLDPDSAKVLLPRDHAGNIDWVAAVSEDVIRPRPTAPGRRVDALDQRFGFDFLFPGPDTTFDAFFEHSTHTQFLQCAQCHSRIFPYRGIEIKMSDVFQGKYCAECHGRVAFPVQTGCERCHRRLSMPPDRAEPDFLGTLVLHRASRDSVTTVSSVQLPNAVFPHWIHRSRYQCKACHMGIFEPSLGANDLSMASIREGKQCGVCHNGIDAFLPTIGTCQRCHVPVGSVQDSDQ